MSELVQARSKYMEIPKQPGSQYTDDQRRAVIADFVVTGNIARTAVMHNMPEQTIRDWTKSEWGVELVGEIRDQKGEELDANLTKLIDAAFEQAQDRIEHGDYRVTKDGMLFRVPMGGYQLVISGATAYDKRQLHRNQPTAISGKSEDMKALANEFAKLSDEMNEKRLNSIPGESEEVE